MKKYSGLFLLALAISGLVDASETPLTFEQLQTEVADFKTMVDDLYTRFHADTKKSDLESKMDGIVKPYWDDNTKADSVDAAINSYDALLDQYTATYKDNNPSYAKYLFGSLYLHLLASKNVIKPYIDVNKNIIGALADFSKFKEDEKAYEVSYDAMTKFLTDNPGFVNPMSSFAVAMATTDKTGFTDYYTLLKNKMNAIGVLENGMTTIVKPFWDDSGNTNVTDVIVGNYDRNFNTYGAYKNNNPSYVQYLFGSLYLYLLLSKNVIKTYVEAHQKGVPVDSIAYKADKDDYVNRYNAMVQFLKDYPSFVNPMRSFDLVMKGFQDYLDYLVTYEAGKAQEEADAKKAADAAVDSAKLDTFISTNFSDAGLIAFADDTAFNTALSSFTADLDTYNKKTDITPDPVYTVWKAYAKVRYYELKFITAEQSSMATAQQKKAMATNYQTFYNRKDFQKAYAVYQKVGKEPYLTQLQEIVLEFELVYQLARFYK